MFGGRGSSGEQEDHTEALEEVEKMFERFKAATLSVNMTLKRHGEMFSEVNVYTRVQNLQNMQKSIELLLELTGHRIQGCDAWPYVILSQFNAQTSIKKLLLE